VVNNYDRPKEVLGMLPHQIMHAARLRLWDMIFESRMLWDCLGCYKCQEYCPQNVRIADVLYQIKNHAIARSISHESSNEPERKAS
jgi:heterodisulfide reductase subunit C